MTLDLLANEETAPKPINIYSNSSFSLQEPMNFKIKISNDKPVILFAAKDHIKGSMNTSNIYEAEQINNVWITEKRSKTRELSQEAEWIAFIKSQRLTTDDWIYAISDSITSSFNSFFLLLVSFVYVISTFLFLLVICYGYLLGSLNGLWKNGVFHGE